MIVNIGKQVWLIINSKEQIDSFKGDWGKGETIDRLVYDKELEAELKQSNLWQCIFPILRMNAQIEAI